MVLATRRGEEQAATRESRSMTTQNGRLSPSSPTTSTASAAVRQATLHISITLLHYPYTTNAIQLHPAQVSLSIASLASPRSQEAADEEKDSIDERMTAMITLSPNSMRSPSNHAKLLPGINHILSPIPPPQSLPRLLQAPFFNTVETQRPRATRQRIRKNPAASATSTTSNTTSTTSRSKRPKIAPPTPGTFLPIAHAIPSKPRAPKPNFQRSRSHCTHSPPSTPPSSNASTAPRREREAHPCCLCLYASPSLNGLLKVHDVLRSVCEDTADVPANANDTAEPAAKLTRIGNGTTTRTTTVPVSLFTCASADILCECCCYYILVNIIRIVGLGSVSALSSSSIDNTGCTDDDDDSGCGNDATHNAADDDPYTYHHYYLYYSYGQIPYGATSLPSTSTSTTTTSAMQPTQPTASTTTTSTAPITTLLNPTPAPAPTRSQRSHYPQPDTSRRGRWRVERGKV
ncbi:hypothetical protein M422DRAFT_254137 [Sphaerobolus stellatus SS14]|uniref:Uncharacterized protein n=1 Tax=Sphaerobolus stellatus (strain SS14) TaxID=990650 RepID=A0A0C9VWI2_SPHS4|nr:hypothetical protein M422DRAFT_254137 [Sphaerobolus stellatus SS14]